ncbi:MAG: arylsulfatase A-like enzyme [Myxococcota bacterium]|jgi:arylsulfatase A-like enzyme
MRAVLTLVVALAACSNDARVEELDRQLALLEADVADTRARIDKMAAGVARAKRHVRPGQRDQSPDDFNPRTPLPPGSADHPDVVLVSIDTLRADHLGAYGYDRDTSPFMDELASTGTVFMDHWSPAPWTLPSHTTMLSGFLPNNHGAIEDHTRIRAQVPMVQEALAASDYLTVGVVATMFVSSKYGFERGFGDVDVDFFDFGVNDKKTNNQSTVDAEHVFDTAYHWAQQQDDGRPIFAFLHVYDVHYHYDPPPPWNEKFDRAPRMGDAIYKSYTDYKKRMVSDEQLAHQVAQYDEEIAYVDHQLGQFVERWRASGRDLIVLVTADHGEEFGERGSWGHAHTLFDEQLHVPLIVNGPGIQRQVVRDRTGGEDLAGTIAGLAGVQFPAGDGVDRSRTLRTGQPVRESAVPGRYADTSRFDTLQYRWHDPPYDLIVDMGRAARRLCDLSSDPGCQENLYRKRKTRGEAMFQELSDHLGQPWIAEQDGTVDLPKGTYAYRGIQRNKQRIEVTAGDRFAVHPLDGKLRIEGIEDAYRALGQDCRLPEEGDPLAYDGPFSCSEGGVEITYDDCIALRELGYVQGDCEALPH